MDIVLYTNKYKGTKVMFNSRKGAGTIVEGIVVQIVPQLNVVIIRDSNNFSHAVTTNTLQQIL